LNDKGALLIGEFASLKDLFPFSIFKACLPQAGKIVNQRLSFILFPFLKVF
jgi:hypothetical protein